MRFTGLLLALVMASLVGCTGTGSLVSPASAEFRSLNVAYESGEAIGSDTPGNLLMDGNFESPVVPKGGLTRFSVGQNLGPWTIVGTSGGNCDLLSYTFMFGGFTFHAESGKQQLDLTGDSNGPNGVAQQVPTVQGKSYKLSFYIGNVVGQGLGSTSTDHVLLDGKQILVATNSKKSSKKVPVWEKFSVTFKAASATSTISFINGDPSTDTYNGLDNVVLLPAT